MQGHPIKGVPASVQLDDHFITLDHYLSFIVIKYLISRKGFENWEYHHKHGAGLFENKQRLTFSELEM